MAPQTAISKTLLALRCASSHHVIRKSAWALGRVHNARGIATSYLQKVAEGDKRWEERAVKIQNGELPHVWDILDERGYIKDVAGYAWSQLHHCLLLRDQSNV
jgi:tyrosyl-tRNA synthetase